MYKDELNIVVQNKWVVPDEAQSATKLNMAIAAGDYPDIFYVQAADYKRYASSNVIADLTSLYDKYLTDNSKKMLNCDNGYALNSIKLNGKYYGLPTQSSPYDSAKLLFLRSDWLKKLNLSAPTTIAELEKVADAFTNQDPDGNGKKDTYGLALDGKDIENWWGDVEPFFEMYNAYPLAIGYKGNFSLVKDNGGKLVWGGSLPGMKPALAELQKFYKNGWIAQDFGTMDGTKAQSEVSSGRAGMFFAPMYGAMTVEIDLLKTNPNATLTAVPIPGVDANTPGKTFLPSSLKNILVVSSKCKHPEALFKIYNIGYEKVAFAKDANTYAKFNGDRANFSGWKLAIFNGLDPMKNYTFYQKIRPAVEKKDPAGLTPDMLLNYNQIVNNYLGKPASGTDNNYVQAWGVYNVFAAPDGGYAAVDKLVKAKNYVTAGFGGAPTDAMATKSATLTDLIKTNIIKIIYGSAPVDSWDSVVTNWNNLGGNDVLKDANEWLNASDGK